MPGVSVGPQLRLEVHLQAGLPAGWRPDPIQHHLRARCIFYDLSNMLLDGLLIRLHDHVSCDATADDVHLRLSPAHPGLQMWLTLVLLSASRGRKAATQTFILGMPAADATACRRVSLCFAPSDLGFACTAARPQRQLVRAQR